MKREKTGGIFLKLIYSNAWLYKLWFEVKPAIKSFLSSDTCTVENKGLARIHKDIKGENHSIQIEKGCVLQNVSFRIRGKNNRIIFGENCTVRKGCSFWMEGENISIEIGSGTSMNHTVHFCAQENGVSIVVGKDCMFANNIIVRTSDSHPIYDLHTGNRLNFPKDVHIGDHVWIAPNTKIMKGAEIGEGSIIGSDSMVTRCIPANSLAVGHPARVVKSDIEWTRQSIF